MDGTQLESHRGTLPACLCERAWQGPRRPNWQAECSHAIGFCRSLPDGVSHGFHNLPWLDRSRPSRQDCWGRRDGKPPLSPHAFELESWVVMVGGVLDDPANAVSAAWCRLLTAADRCGIQGDQFVTAPERANDFGRLVDLNLEDRTIWPTIRNVGDGDDRAGAIQRLAGIEQLDQLLGAVEFFRHNLR